MLTVLYPILLFLSMCASPRADEGYADLWKRGEYARALHVAEKEIQSEPYASLARSYATWPSCASSPGVSTTPSKHRKRWPVVAPSDPVRLAEDHRYQGPTMEADEVLEKAAGQGEAANTNRSVSGSGWPSVASTMQGTDAKPILAHYP